MKLIRNRKFRFGALILVFVVMMTTIAPANINVLAAAADNSYAETAEATPGDADGIYKAVDGKYYYYVGGKIVTKAGCINDGKGIIYVLENGGVVTTKLVKSGAIRRCYTYTAGSWQMLKGAYKTVDGVLYYFNSGSGIAARMYNNSTGRLYKYASSKMKLVKSDVSTIRGNRIYFFNSKGQKITKAGWYTLASGARVYVNSNGYVTVKMPANGRSRRYYSYDYKALKWSARKSTWANTNGVDYYFAKNGIAVYMYNTKSGKLTHYRNGKWNSAKNTIHALKNEKIYLFNSKSVVTKKVGWHDISSTDKVYVSSKGYVTMKFSTKSGKLYKYNYSKKKWKLVKVTSYKIGKKTYYFDSNGVAAKNKIVGNEKTGYFYIDSTGCKVTSKEIKMAVDFVMKHKKQGMSNNDILHNCYLEMATYGYQRDYVVPDVSRFPDLSCDTLINRYGNCYRFASTLACIATVLGYKARVTCGMVPAVYGYGQTIHGWTEIWNDKDKAWKVYDVNMQRVWTEQEISFYNQFIYNYYPGRHSIDFRVGLTVKNGTARWSKL